jgi:hypothetical protein
MRWMARPWRRERQYTAELSCSRCRAREAAIDPVAVAKPGAAFIQLNRVRRFGEDCVLERSLASLDSGYRRAYQLTVFRASAKTLSFGEYWRDGG